MERAISKDGTAIAYRRTGAGPALLLVHGTTTDHTRWAPVVDALEQRHTVYAVDRRGRGGSGDAAAYAIEREAEDLLAAIAAIGEPYDLLGHSFGGLVALEAVALGARPRRLVLYEPPVLEGEAIYPSELLARIEELLGAGDRAGVVTTFCREVARMSPSEVGALQALPSWAGRVAAAHTIPREMRAPVAYRLRPERFASCGFPTLLLVGSESPGFLARATDRVRAALPGSRMVVLPGQAHVAMNTAPALFVEAVLGAKPSLNDGAEEVRS